MCWMSKPDLEIQHLTSKTVFQTEDFWENILIESHKVWRDNKSIKGIILVRFLVDYLGVAVACSPPSFPPPVVKTRHLAHPAQSSELSDNVWNLLSSQLRKIINLRCQFYHSSGLLFSSKICQLSDLPIDNFSTSLPIITLQPETQINSWRFWEFGWWIITGVGWGVILSLQSCLEL